MKKIRIAVALLSASCLLVLSDRLITWACGGSSGSVCVVSNTACLKTMVMAKAMPFVVVVPPATPVTFGAPVNLFVACPTQNNCGQACASAAMPTSASITLSLYPFPCLPPLPPPTATGTISTAGGMALPTCSANGDFNSYSVPITIPAGTPLGVYCVIGTATINFSDGTTLTQTGDTVVCLVEESPNQPGLPRLDVQLLSDNFPRTAPGGQAIAMYKITNRDDNQTLENVMVFADSQQIADDPNGASERTGAYAIAHPFGDDFPIAFDPGATCIPLPPHPFTQGEISMALASLAPGASTTVNVGIRSYGGCGSGSCSESILRVQGNFAGEPMDSARACAGMAFYADTSLPTQGCAVGENDCNHNNVPDAVDIFGGTSLDANFNALPDECEMNAPRILNPVQVTPSVVTLPTEIISLSLVSVSPTPVTNAWANGTPLNTMDGQTWTGQLTSDPQIGPHTVYGLIKNASGQLATHIGLYCRGQSFQDVPLSHLFYNHIGTLSCYGITSGCSANPSLFCPDASVLRSQMAVFLLRAKLGRNYTPPPATGIFADVPNDFFAPWIEDLFNRGITSGCATMPLRYCPANPVRRDQMAVFLLRTKLGSNYMPPPATGLFADVPNDFFAPWIEDLFNRGITSGCATMPLRYCPADPVRRDQMAVFITRTFELIFPPS